MKKLSLNASGSNGGEVLTRSQLKRVMGGNGSGSGTGSCTADCGDGKSVTCTGNCGATDNVGCYSFADGVLDVKTCKAA